MKLITFTGANSQKLSNGHPNIGVNQKTGVFNINKVAVERMNLKAEMQVILHQDEEEPANWYLEIVEEDGFCLRGGNKDANIYFNSVQMARTIGEAMSIDGSYKMKIAAEAVVFEKRKLWSCNIQSTT